MNLCFDGIWKRDMAVPSENWTLELSKDLIRLSLKALNPHCHRLLRELVER